MVGAKGVEHGPGDQLARQWKIIETLLASHTGKSAAELADELDCNCENCLSGS